MKDKNICLVVILVILQTATCDDDDENRNNTVAENIVYTLNDLNRLFQEHVLKTDDFVFQVKEEPEEEYDFIVIGGGSAGCTITNRLTEVSSWDVALFEAGEPETNYMDIPLASTTSLGGKYDWLFETVPQEKMGHCLRDRKMRLPRGKCLGGSSCINAMMYCRGNKIDYNFWAQLGNVGWSYDEVICYFKKSEDAHLKDIEPRYHGFGGYLGVENSYQSDFVDAFRRGGEEIGLPYIDYNAATKSFGVSGMQATIQKGRRESTARAFLRPIASRENLNIFIEAFVTKILVDGNKRAYGVEVEKGGRTYTVRARKEVVLSAGAIQSPQLLMVSGIGPRDVLEKYDIKLHKHLPGVGQNLKDHLTFNGLIYTVPFDRSQGALALALSFPEYVLFGKGLLTTIAGVEGVGYVRTPIARTHKEQPDMELMFLGASLAVGLGNYIKTVFGLLDECYDSLLKPLEGGYQWSVGPLLLHPNSTGYLQIVAADPHVPPEIDQKYYSDEDNHDVRTMIAGIRETQKLFRTKPFVEYGAKLSPYKLHGCEQHTFDSDEYWECALRGMSLTLYHQIGTCKMGPEGDPMAVVNPRLQVYGIGGLRVIDASIMPSHISGHTNAAAIMIGEKGADLIKELYGVLKYAACEKYGVNVSESTS